MGVTAPVGKATGSGVGGEVIEQALQGLLVGVGDVDRGRM